ncbi:hypothetical protein IWW48_005396 [Coemansia sp. RSA 1200]|nr:hypothetical protein IWW48_005396 [Coemansia sp. RSA 1200]
MQTFNSNKRSSSSSVSDTLSNCSSIASSNTAPLTSAKNEAELLHKELQEMIEYCAQLENENGSLRCQLEAAVNPPPCPKFHGMSWRDREMVKRLKEEKSWAECDLKLSESMLNQEEKARKWTMKQINIMEWHHRHEVTRLTGKHKELMGERDSLMRQLDDAQDKISKLNKAELASVAALEAERADSRKRIQELEDRCAQLQEDVANTPPCTQQLESSRIRSYSQVSTDAPTMAESTCDQVCEQSDLDDERTGLATPPESGESKGFFYPGQEHSALLQSETMAAPLTPPPTPPQAFRRYSTGSTLVCLEAETTTAKAPAKAVTATKAAATKAAAATKTAAVKAARSIRRAASAMAHMRFYH